MSPDTLPPTPTPEVSTPAPAEADSRANTAEKDLSVTIDALDVLQPEKSIKTIANLDFKIEDVIPPPTEAAEAEAPEAKPVEKAADTPVEVPAEEVPTEEPAETSSESGDRPPKDPDTLIPDSEQPVAREQMARMKGIMADLVKNPQLSAPLKAEMIAKAAAAGIDLDPTKPLGEKKITKGQKWAIGLIGTFLFALMAVGSGARTA